MSASRKDFSRWKKIQLIQEQLCGFILDEVINPAGEYYASASMLTVTNDKDKGNEKQYTASITTKGQQSNDKDKEKKHS